jgi:acetyl esterase/lipase
MKSVFERIVPASVFVSLISFSSAQTAQRISDQVYMKEAGVAFTCDVFKPEKPNGIVVVHLVSGGWVSDHKSINVPMAAEANKRGFTMVQVVHGAQPKYKVPEIARMISRSIRFIRYNAKNWGFNPDKIAVTGGSAGGHLSLLTAAKGDLGNANSTDPVEKTSSVINSVGVFFPPTDFMNFGREGAMALDNPMLKVGFGKAFYDDEKAMKREEMIKMGENLSPVRFFTSQMPPTMIIHGDKDALVPLQQSEVAIAKLNELKIKNRLVVVPGVGHGWPNMLPQFNQLLDWFEESLK